jgi:hypothetical protein
MDFGCHLRGWHTSDADGEISLMFFPLLNGQGFNRTVIYTEQMLESYLPLAATTKRF